MSYPTADSYFKHFAHCHSLYLIGPQAEPKVPISDPVIFVDGGSNIRENNMGISVGDGDSAVIQPDILLNPEKDFSDLFFALSLIPEHFSEIILAGFSGGRMDHYILNLGEINRFLKSRLNPCRVILDQQVLGFSAGRWEFQTDETFSLIFFQQSNVSLTGQCKYHIPADTSVNAVSSFGLSNEGCGTISLDTSEPAFVFLNSAL